MFYHGNRKEWKPGFKECAMLRRQMYIPQSTQRYVNVLSNESVIKGLWQKVILKSLILSFVASEICFLLVFINTESTHYLFEVFYFHWIALALHLHEHDNVHVLIMYITCVFFPLFTGESLKFIIAPQHYVALLI